MKNLLKIRWTELFRLKITFFTLHLDSFLKVFCYGLVACILIHQRLIVKDRLEISPRTSVTQRSVSSRTKQLFSIRLILITEAEWLKDWELMWARLNRLSKILIYNGAADICRSEITELQCNAHSKCASQGLHGFVVFLPGSDCRPHQLLVKFGWHTLLRFLLPQCRCL
jgi:hypothetical protein